MLCPVELRARILVSEPLFNYHCGRRWLGLIYGAVRPRRRFRLRTFGAAAGKTHNIAGRSIENTEKWAADQTSRDRAQNTSHKTSGLGSIYTVGTVRRDRRRNRGDRSSARRILLAQGAARYE